MLTYTSTYNINDRVCLASESPIKTIGTIRVSLEDKHFLVRWQDGSQTVEPKAALALFSRAPQSLYFVIGSRVYFKASDKHPLGIVIEMFNNDQVRVCWDNGVMARHDVNEIGDSFELIAALSAPIPH